MLKIHSYLLCGLGLIAISGFYGCSKNETLPPADLKFGYYPAKVGNVVIYQVDSTVYNGSFGLPDIIYKFEIKDTVVADISNSTAKSVRIERYKRPENGKWIYQKTLTRSIIGRRAEEFIDNQRYVRLIFPPVVQAHWDGNVYNLQGLPPSDPDYNYIDRDTILAVDQKQTINSIVLDSTLTVQELKNSNLIREDYKLAVYAKNIGLVKREVRALDKNITNQQITRGYKYIMLVKSFK